MRALCVLCASVAILFVGCAKKKVAAEGEAPAVGVVEAPAAPIAKSGLEVWWWLADDSNGQVGEIVAGLSDPAVAPGVTEKQRERWERNGLRWVRVPAEKLAELERSARPLRVTARTAYGWPTAWTEVFRGSRVGRGSGRVVLVTDQGGEAVTPGRMRLLARCWEAPMAGPDGLTTAVRLELAVQSQTKGITPDDEPFALPKVMPSEEQGEVLRILTVETTLERGAAYVITSEKPGVVWGVSEEDMAVQSDGHGTQYGPKGPTPTTVGEAMMTASVPEEKGKVAKAVVVVIVR